MTQLTVADIKTLCAETIRVQVDWSRLDSAEDCVATMVLSQPSDLSRFVLPWYVHPVLGETTWDDPAGQPLCADDLPARVPELSASRQEAVLRIARAHGRCDHPVLVTVTGYELPAGRWLVLDGNHRLAALLLRPTPFRALFVGVKGPLDRRVVPDLARHGG